MVSNTKWRLKLRRRASIGIEENINASKDGNLKKEKKI